MAEHNTRYGEHALLTKLNDKTESIKRILIEMSSYGGVILHLIF